MFLTMEKLGQKTSTLTVEGRQAVCKTNSGEFTPQNFVTNDNSPTFKA